MDWKIVRRIGYITILFCVTITVVKTKEIPPDEELTFDAEAPAAPTEEAPPVQEVTPDEKPTFADIPASSQEAPLTETPTLETSPFEPPAPTSTTANVPADSTKPTEAVTPAQEVFPTQAPVSTPLLPVVLTPKAPATRGPETATPGFPQDQELSNSRSSYIVPVEVDDEADRFRKGNKEYYFYATRLNYYLATQLCINKYHGRLAWIRNPELAKFLAEALSETRLDMDTLWTGGRKEKEDSKWKWQDNKRKEEISESITKNIVSISGVEATNRHCLGFGREDHDLPQFRALACSVERSVLCESHSRLSDSNGSTHPGWIALGNYEYKIFRNRVSWAISNTKCGNYDSRTKLATVFNFEIAQQLGRHLLIGRPSLENAWIAGKWDTDSYKWMEFDKTIPCTTNATTKYPPWKGDKVTKTNGCILLDRHVSNITLFVEARCERQRSFICYRDNKNKTDEVNKNDIIIGTNGYRLITNKMIWEDAYNFCLKYKKYEMKLAEIRDESVKNHLLYIMGDNKTAIHHIWLGGRFNTSASNFKNAWYWETDKAVIPPGSGSILNWVQNSTYVQDVEELNVCLNMDRENHKTALHYGTYCMEPQQFVCQCPKGKLLELQNDEENDNVITETPILLD